MKGLITIGLALLVMGLGFWAYQENYATQASLREVRELKVQIAAAQARLDRLEAEWAYLNRPDRLRDLAEINFQRLELLPLMPEAFAAVDEVPMPSDMLAPVVSELIVSHGTPGNGEEPL